MEEWLQRTLSSEQLGLVAIPAMFLLGALGAVSSCCSLPVLGALTGYSGSLRQRPGRRELLLVGLFFMVGTILALTTLGAATGFVGRVAGASLGKYWRFAAGLVMVLFGLSSLGLLPLRIPQIPFGSRAFGDGVVGSAVFGLAVGGATTACTIGCNPLLSVGLGAAVLRGETVFGATMLGSFALGYSVPLAAGLVGIGFGLGRLGGVSQRVMPVIRMAAGAVLIAVGFYLLAVV